MEDSQADWNALMRLARRGNVTVSDWERILRERQAHQPSEWSQLDSVAFDAEYEVWKQLLDEYGISL